MNEAVTAAWDRVIEQWDDPARHDALVGLVAQHSCFAWAAARYKERAGDPIADKQLERLRKAAMATMLATATRSRDDTPATPYRKTILWFAVMVILLVLGLVCTRLALDNRPTKTAPAGRPTPVRH